jgi:hypothetical protein
MHIPFRAAAAAALIAAAALPASAANISWTLGPTFGGPLGHQGILTNGSLVQAVNLVGQGAAGSTVVDPTGLNLSFTNANTVPFDQVFQDPANGIGDAGWAKVIQSFEWKSASDVDAPSFLSGLVVGTTYQAQFFFARSNLCCTARTQRFGDGNGNFSASVRMDAFQSVVGTFVADASTQRIVFDDSSNNPVLSAYVLRDLTAAPIPEPGTWALMLAGLGAVGFTARRRQSGVSR